MLSSCEHLSAFWGTSRFLRADWIFSRWGSNLSLPHSVIKHYVSTKSSVGDALALQLLNVVMTMSLAPPTHKAWHFLQWILVCFFDKTILKDWGWVYNVDGGFNTSTWIFNQSISVKWFTLGHLQIKSTRRPLQSVV